MYIASSLYTSTVKSLLGMHSITFSSILCFQCPPLLRNPSELIALDTNSDDEMQPNIEDTRGSNRRVRAVDTA